MTVSSFVSYVCLEYSNYVVLTLVSHGGFLFPETHLFCINVTNVLQSEAVYFAIPGFSFAVWQISRPFKGRDERREKSVS